MLNVKCVFLGDNENIEKISKKRSVGGVRSKLGVNKYSSLSG